MKTPTNHTGRNSAFSLVEVTIAMAIAAVAVISLIGMIPSGMDTMVKAGDTAIMARIHQSVLGEMQLTEFDQLKKEFHLKERHYDSQGEKLEEGDQDFGFKHIYSARIHAPNKGDRLPAKFGSESGTYRGIELGGEENKRLQLIIVEVAPAGGRYSAQGAAYWDDEENFDKISTYQSMVADMAEDYGR